MPQLEDYNFITGRGRYIDDINLINQAYIYLIRSPYARARILKISPPSSRHLLFLTGKELNYYVPSTIDNDLKSYARIVDMPILARDYVNFVGQPVAAVVTEKKLDMEDLAEEVSVEYEPLKPVVDPIKALESEEIHPNVKKNLAVDIKLEGGDLSLLRSSEVVVERELKQNRIVANPIETKGVIVDFDGQNINVIASTQSTFRVKGDIERSLGIPGERIKVYAPNVGGGFGNKTPAHAEYLVSVIASMKLSRPIKWIETRREHLTNPFHGRGVISKMKLHAKKDGTILGIEGEIIVDIGAYTYSINPNTAAFISRLTNGPYAMKFASIRAMGVYTNKTPMGPYRGAGRPEAALIHETLIEDLAEELKMDPAEIREKNFIKGEYLTPLGFRIDKGDYPRVFKRALKHYYEARKKYGRGYGVSIVCFLEMDRGSPGEGAKLKVTKDGIEILVGTHNHGQSHYTSFSLLASEVLGIPQSMITVKSGTSELQRGVGSFGSRSLIAGGAAVYEVCRLFREEAKKRGLSVENALKEMIGYEVEVFYPGIDIFSFGSHVAVVKIDEETKRAELVEYYAVDDVGKSVNKEAIDSQVIGGVIQGAAQVLWESAEYDEDGNPNFSSIADEGVPSAVEARVKILVEEENSPSPYSHGARGVGEAGTIGALASTFIALERALGIKLKSTPYKFTS